MKTRILRMLLVRIIIHYEIEKKKFLLSVCRFHKKRKISLSHITCSLKDLSLIYLNFGWQVLQKLIPVG
jgi:hypothetical protein